MHNSCLGISPKYLIFRNAPKPIIDLCGISFLCANFETFTIFSAIVLKTCTHPPYYRTKICPRFAGLCQKCFEQARLHFAFWSGHAGMTSHPHHHTLTLFDMGGHDGPPKCFCHCARMLRRSVLKLGDF